MNTYEGIWLQFVFPFYIWILCILIIILSRKSPILTALLGNNPVAVLATLFLLSHTKILHTITAALSFTQVEYPHNQSKTVWLYDANVPIAKWLPLAVFSVVMFFLLFPYTLFLFSNQWLLAWSDWHLLSWMNSPRIKFFLDAHNAPFKSKYRYWTGLLLIGRLLVQIVFAVNVLGNPALDILAISIVAASLAAWQSVWGSPYTNTCISILEVSFIVNILFLAVTTFYAQLTTVGSNIDILGYISTGVAFSTFLGIVLFHIYLRMRDTALCRTLCKRRDTSMDRTGTDFLWDGRYVDSETEDEPLLSCTELGDTPPELPIGYTL